VNSRQHHARWRLLYPHTTTGVVLFTTVAAIAVGLSFWKAVAWPTKANLAQSNLTTAVLATMGMRAICATVQPSSSTTQTSSANGCATRRAAAQETGSVRLPTLDRNCWYRIFWIKRRQSPRRSSLLTDSRRSGVPLAGHTTGKTASTRTHTVTGGEFPSLAIRHIRVRGGQTVWPVALLK